MALAESTIRLANEGDTRVDHLTVSRQHKSESRSISRNTSNFGNFWGIDEVNCGELADNGTFESDETTTKGCCPTFLDLHSDEFEDWIYI